MIETIKKTLLAGVGATVVTKEKIEHALEEWVRQGKVSANDVNMMASRIAEVGKREFETLSAELATQLKDVLAKADLGNKARIEALEARIRILEDKLSSPPPASSRVGEP
ncbi:MAG TPA: hypothetical protein VKC60_05155 [Opitutaceae bacterium]|nr:hypothetical protein [Opitutaceae bacterium]